MRYHRGEFSSSIGSLPLETKRSTMVIGLAVLTMKETSKKKRVFRLDMKLTPLENIHVQEFGCLYMLEHKGQRAREKGREKKVEAKEGRGKK